jgi:hypothetical protein
MTKPDGRWTALHASLVFTLALEFVAPASVAAQVAVGSLDELRRVLDPDDVISVVRTTGESVSGRLLRIGDTDLDLEIESRPPSGRGRRTSLTIPLTAIQSLDRPRDSARNGALIGAGIGAAVAGGLFVYALAIDRNEIDEWAPIYLGCGALFGGAGALVGWAIDSGRSKPHITFGTRPGKAVRVTVTPSLSRRVVGATLVASF